MRWAKNRLHHCNQISHFIRNSPRYKDLFEGCRTVLELLGEHELNFSIGVPNSGSLTRPNGVEFDGDKTSDAGRAFTAYVTQAPMHCFNFLIATLRNDPLIPWSEYLLPAYSGIATWSAICDLGTGKSARYTRSVTLHEKCYGVIISEKMTSSYMLYELRINFEDYNLSRFKPILVWSQTQMESLDMGQI